MFDRNELIILGNAQSVEKKFLLILELLKTGMKPNEMALFLNEEREKAGLVHTVSRFTEESVKSDITRMINEHYRNKDNHDLLFKVFASGDYCSKRNIYFMPMWEPLIDGIRIKTRKNTYDNFSFARWQNGQLKKPSDFKEWLSSKGMIRLVLQTVILADDKDGLLMLLNIPRVKKAIGDDLTTMFKKNSIPLSYSVNEILLSRNGGKAGYVKVLNDLCSANDHKRIVTTYNKDFSKELGHVIICGLMNINNDASKKLCEILVKDGADWFMGVKQHIHGYAAYYDLKDRQVSLEDELELILSMHADVLKTSSSAMSGILKSIPEHKIVKAVAGTRLADEVHKLTGYEGVLQMASNGYKKSAIRAELSI